MLIWLTLLFAVTFAIVAAVVLIAGLALENAGPDDSSLFKNEQLSSISVWHSLLARFDFAGTLKNQLAQSGLDWSAGRLTLSVLLCGVATFTLVSRVSWIPLWAGTACAWLAALAPYAYVLRV